MSMYLTVSHFETSRKVDFLINRPDTLDMSNDYLTIHQYIGHETNDHIDLFYERWNVVQ